MPNIPSDKLLAELLRKYPESVFKYHEHDSLLEKEDDLTEEEKESAWKQYEQEAKANEARLHLMNDMKMSLETPPFNDSQSNLIENDQFWDEFNGNKVTKPAAKTDDDIWLLSPTHEPNQKQLSPLFDNIARPFGLAPVTKQLPSSMAGAGQTNHSSSTNSDERTLICALEDSSEYVSKPSPVLKAGKLWKNKIKSSDISICINQQIFRFTSWFQCNGPKTKNSGHRRLDGNAGDTTSEKIQTVAIDLRSKQTAGTFDSKWFVYSWNQRNHSHSFSFQK